MRKLKLYIACSIDGYIARKDGTLDWLDAVPNPDELDYGYGEFYATIDTTIMGSSTYKEVLGFDVPWPYTECQSYILSRKGDVEIATPSTHLVKEDIPSFIKKLKEEEGKDIWIIGGGQIIYSFLDLGLVDEMLLTLAPVILGDGIPLFPGSPLETNFELIKTEGFNSGFVNLEYRRK